MPLAPGPRSVNTVFMIVMENKNSSQIRANPSAPYINTVLLPAASYAAQYFNPPGIHPSEPNYLWLEGGTNYGIHDDADPASHHLPNKDHLVSLLTQAGISWKAYQEGIDGTECPLVSDGLYAARHNPLLFSLGRLHQPRPAPAGARDRSPESFRRAVQLRHTGPLQ